MPPVTVLHRNYQTLQRTHGLEAPFGLPEGPVETAGLNIWARSEPKAMVFDHFADVAAGLGVDMHVYIDDVCAQLVTGRTDEEQRGINAKYTDFFASRELPTSFSSELIGKLSLVQTLAISSCLTVAEFTRAVLPEKKQNSRDLRLSELSHAAIQLAFLQDIAQREKLLLSGRFSQGVLNIARSITPDFPSVITVRAIADENRPDAV